MAKKTIIYWRDIPSQVVVKQGRTSAKKQLTKRFMVAIDRAAMRAGRQGSTEYREPADSENTQKRERRRNRSKRA